MGYILVIEDDIQYLELIELILKMESLEVQTAMNGAQGIAKLKERRPDLILCDIMMPEMDGHTFFATLQNIRDYSDVPIIFVTALNDRAELRKSMSQGVDDYLTKPFSADELIACVVGRLNRFKRLSSCRPPTFNKEELAMLKQLTPREVEILNMVGAGDTSKRIADCLGIRLKTVEAHRANLMNKLNVKNSAQLARWAMLLKN